MTLLLLFQPAGSAPPGGATGTAFESFVGGGMYLGRWEIDDYLTFTAQTHDSTGAAADADAVPSYAIYEDETAGALVTGNMAKLGAVTGFYTERVQLTALAGFEVNKSYTVRVQATVGGIAAAKADQFCLGGVTIRGTKNTLDDLPTADDIADATLKRDWTSVSGEAARSVLNALRFLRNKWSISGTTLTVTKENDTDTAWQGELSTSESADSVVGVDPG